MRDQDRGKRLIAVCLLGLVLINFPLLAVVEAGHRWFGLPPLFLYLFGALGRADRAASADRRAPHRALRPRRAMLNSWVLLLVSSAYLGVLFAVAYFGDRRAEQGRSIINSPYVYTLSIAVYCTAWTFYGSVGLAADGRRRISAGLSRADADGLPVVVRAAPHAAHHQGLRHHLDRRLHRLALRQERAARRPGHDDRADRHHAVHLAAAEGGLDQRLGDPRLPGDGAVLARSRPVRRPADGCVQHPVRHPAHRRHRASPGHGGGDRLRIRGQADRLRHRRRVRHLCHVRRLRRHLRPGHRGRLRPPADLSRAPG